MAEFSIASRTIGYEHDPLVIVEIGINHEGSLDTACRMIDAARSAGAEIVKHQTHIIDDEMSAEATSIIPGNTDSSIYDVMARCALSEADEFALKDYVEGCGMIFISTPFSRAAADRLEKMGVPAYKIGSGECNNYPLLEHIAAFGKPIIMSTGMNARPAIEKAVEIFRRQAVPFALLHTTNLYPTPPELVRLGALAELMDHFSDAVIGLSDHTTSNHACFGAVALGASILERHFTDDMSRPGPDIVCSMDPRALRELIEGARILRRERGGGKTLLDEEEVTRRFAFVSVVSIQPIATGETLSAENIWVKRPGTGDFSAEDYDVLLGRTARRDIAPNVQLKKADVN